MGPKLEQEAVFINNLADPRARDTKYIKYCWDILLCHSKEEHIKWCWRRQSVPGQTFWKNKISQKKGKAEINSSEGPRGPGSPLLSYSLLCRQPSAHASSKLGFQTQKTKTLFMAKIIHVPGEHSGITQKHTKKKSMETAYSPTP